MSDTLEQPRNEAGQFTSTEELYGQSALLADNDWKAVEKPKEEEPEASTSEQLREAADELAERRAPETSEPREMFLTANGERAAPVWDEDGTRTEGEKLALRNAEQAAEALAALRNAETEAQAVDADAEFLKSLGIETQEKPAEAVEQQPHEQQPETAQEQQPQKQPDPELFDKALQNVRAQYAAQLDTAVKVAEFSFLQQFPEFKGITDPSHLASVASSIQQQNPERWRSIEQTAAQASQLVQAHAAESARAEQARQLQQAAIIHELDQKWAASSKTTELSPEMKVAFQEGMTKHGLTPQQVEAEWRTNAALHHPLFQELLADGLKLRAMQKAAPKAVQKSLPPVLRPGAAQPRSVRAADNLAAQIKSKSSLGIDDAVRLLQARRG